MSYCQRQEFADSFSMVQVVVVSGCLDNCCFVDLKQKSILVARKYNRSTRELTNGFLEGSEFTGNTEVAMSNERTTFIQTVKALGFV